MYTFGLCFLSNQPQSWPAGASPNDKRVEQSAWVFTAWPPRTEMANNRGQLMPLWWSFLQRGYLCSGLSQSPLKSMEVFIVHWLQVLGATLRLPTHDTQAIREPSDGEQVKLYTPWAPGKCLDVRFEHRKHAGFQREKHKPKQKHTPSECR